METMMKIINALAALTAALQEYTTQTTEGYINTFEEIYTPPELEEQLEEEPPKVATLEEVRSVFSSKSRAGFTKEIKALLKKHGADKLSGIKKEEYAALL